MKKFLCILLIAEGLAQVCTNTVKGEGHCDRVCMTEASSYDSASGGLSDCREKCLSHCAAADLDSGNCKAECLTWDCAWGGGACGECSVGCQAGLLGNGLCEAACDVAACSFDAGDCAERGSPSTVYVSSTAAIAGDGSWTAPFNSLAYALESLWLPFNTVFLLRGSHLLVPPSSSVFLANEVLAETTISTLFCTLQPGDHADCATSRAIIQVTSQFASFSVLRKVSFESVIFQGGFSLKAGCSLPTCLYCPYVALDTAHGVYRNDREEDVNLANYAAQSLCDFYHDKSFIVVTAAGRLTISNTVFTSFRQQLKALIWNECGDIELENVDFYNCVPAPQGLNGGLLGQTCPDSQAPYYCGHFSYISGTVSHLNDGYEYRNDIVTSGFLAADGLNSFYVESVIFEYNLLLIGELVTTMDSSMLSLGRFRTAIIKDCVFRYNIASLSVGLSIINSFQFPLILDANNIATEHQLHHVTLTGLNFYNNTSEVGTLLYVQFHTNHQNIIMTNCRFTNNFSTMGALIHVQNDQLLARYQNGEYVEILVKQVLTQVWVSARYFNLTHLTFEANFANSVAYLAEIGNVILNDIQVMRSGESSQHYTALDYVIKAHIALQSTYLSAKSMGYPAAFTCENALVITSVMQISIESMGFEAGYCPHGSPGITVIGSPTILLFHTIAFTRNTGFELLSFTVNTTVQLSALTFTDNSNHVNSKSVCISAEFTQAASITITNANFTGNQGEAGAVGTIFHAKTVEMEGILIERNVARYSGAGLMLSPNAYEFSTLSFKKCVFRGNVGDSKGALTVLDFYGILSDNFLAVVTLVVEDCQFIDNFSSSQGAAITIYDFIQLSPTSHISNCLFKNNTCDTGASVYLTYQTGITTVASCTFDSNTSPNGGAGVYANQFPDSQAHRTYVLVKDCVFRGSKGPSIAIDGKLVQNELIGEHNIFEGNYDSAVLIRTGLYVDTESIYRNNSAEYGAGVYLKLYSAAQIQGSLFDRNVAEVEGGAIYSRFFCPAEFTNCTFRNNVGNSGGVVYADTTLGMKFEGCQMSNNSAIMSGSAMYSFAGSVYFLSTSVVANTAHHYSLFVMLESYAEVRNCTVDSNTAPDRTAGILMTSSVLYIYDSRFTNQTSKNGGFILSLNNNELHINGSTFSLGTALQDGGAIYITLDSQLLISYSRFYNCSAGLLGGALFTTKSATVANHVDFFNNSAKSGGSIDITDGTAWISGCRFENYTGGAVHAETTETLVIANSSFRKGVGVSYRGAGVYTVDVMRVNITNCTFELNRAKRGGGAYFYSTAQGGAVNDYQLLGNRFESNSAPSGGGLEADGVNLIAANNTFVNNSAYYIPGALLVTNGVGGAMVLRCDNPLQCDVTVAHNSFQRNTASIDGGAVHWQESPPVFQSNFLEGNVAEYGSDIASYPIALAPVSASLERVVYQDNSTSVPLAFTLDSFVSGQVYTNTLRFGLFDHLWQLVKIANTSAIELEVGSNTTLSGQFKGSSHMGVFEMHNFAIIAEPGTSRTIYFSTDGVETSKKSIYNDTAHYISTIAVKVNFRLCESGETISNGACVVCQSETYSLDPQKPCKTCLSSAVCYGGSIMVPRAGYWRARNDSDTFFECLNAAACLGSPEPPLTSLTGLCAEGYMGNLCQVCKPDYSRTGRSNCARCPGRTANISVSTLIVVVALCGIALIVSLAIRSATKPRSLMAIYFKIFLNYLQMVVVAASLNLNWPSFVKTFLSTQEMAGGMADQLFSFECLLKDLSFTNSMGMFAAKLMAGALLPITLMGIALLAWGLLRLIKNVDLLLEKLVASCVVILFIVHPSITKMMFSVYSCMEILPGESWVIADLAEQCWTARHFKAVFFISVPSLAVWVLGLPTLVLGLLIKAHLRLHEMSQRVKFSFLYKGYEQKWFFWEFVILYRKIAIVSASVFLSPMSVRVESLTILAILLVAIYLQLRYLPYNEPTLNKLEVKSILVSAVTIYAGLYYDTQSMSNFHLGSIINMLLFVVIIVANAYFLVTWLIYISPVIFATLREKWTFLARFGKQYRVRPLQPSTMGLKDGDKSDNSISSIAMVSSIPIEGTISHTESIIPPANTPTRIGRENTDREDPGLAQEFSIR